LPAAPPSLQGTLKAPDWRRPRAAELEDAQDHYSNDMEDLKISLIIPAFNEGKYIGRTLDSVNKAKDHYKNPSLIEIIVVDNNSTDNTEQIAKKKGATVVKEEKRCIASVRNRGAQVSRGSVLGFLDADSSVSPNIFNSIDDVMSSGKYIGGGMTIKLDRKSLGIFLTRCLTTIPAKWLFGVAGGLIFTGRQTFESLGGFDESLYCAEDTKFILGMKKHGKTKGQKFKVITTNYVISSSRSFDQFSDWYYFKNLPKIALRGGIKAFRDKDFCWRFWYNVRR